jgi:hypothetical protein
MILEYTTTDPNLLARKVVAGTLQIGELPLAMRSEVSALALALEKEAESEAKKAKLEEAKKKKEK